MRWCGEGRRERNPDRTGWDRVVRVRARARAQAQEVVSNQCEDGMAFISNKHVLVRSGPALERVEREGDRER